ncbi:cell division protein SepF 2 [Paractinoplanes deccanensis]|uniref:Cell division protein SepF n=1 Tax=Paractinoplanes deccanensis TaxID=113561 RepID=A0ABQ3YGK4_9ACTN|nr:cell division protein SepF [Actinoplanes deccanensis]GID79122.1 cell division protein SepF 2 [Actinoplanes deccanensis]
MSAFVRKAGVWLGLVEEDDDRDYGYRDDSYHRRDRRHSAGAYETDFDDEDEEFEEERTVPRARTERAGRLSSRLSAHDDVDDEPVERTERASVRSITRSGAGADDSSVHNYSTRENLALAPQTVHQPQPAPRQAEEEQRYQITTLHPTTYREARTIGEHFRDGVPVIINLTEMDEGDARRLVDFAAGLAFGLRGTIERVTNRVFLLSPANVQVTAEDKAKIAEGGFFSQG